MTLRKATRNQTPAASQTPTADVSTETATLFEPETPSIDAEAAAKVEATTAIAKAQSTAMDSVTKIKGAFTSLQNAISLEDVESMGVGAFPRVTVDLGGFTLDKAELGTEIKLELLSWNFRYMITTGADDEESKKKLKISYDGETCTSGESVSGVLEAFREEGYEKAAKKMYVDLWGSLASKNGENIEPEDRPLVQVQLSPESVKKFKAFQVELGFKQARGLVSDTPLVSLKSARGEWKGNRFGYCTFALK